MGTTSLQIRHSGHSRPCATLKVEGNRTASLWQSSSRSYGLYIVRPGLIKHEQHDPVLKRRFEEGVASAELRQYLRLHQRDLDFRQTTEKARIFAATMGETKAKKSLRFMSESPAPAIHHMAVPTIDTQATFKQETGQPTQLFF